MKTEYIETIDGFLKNMPEGELGDSIRVLMSVATGDHKYERKIGIGKAVGNVKKFRKSIKVGCSLDKALGKLVEVMDSRKNEHKPGTVKKG